MIVNPYKYPHLMQTFAGTRLLQQDFGLIGCAVTDPYEKRRQWRVHALYAPVEGRSIGGFRAKFVDQKHVVTFINQMDLEVLLGLGEIGRFCPWAGRDYVGPGAQQFYGMAADEDDLVDDLFDREMMIRGSITSGMLPANTDFLRYVHLDEGRDVEEYYTLLWDGDPETGIAPDIRFETVEKRWVRVERMRAPWDLIGL